MQSSLAITLLIILVGGAVFQAGLTVGFFTFSKTEASQQPFFFVLAMMVLVAAIWPVFYGAVLVEMVRRRLKRRKGRS